jgi:hypothetical protein
MEHAMNRPMREFSLGMRQRAKIAQAIAHDPELLILDEPFNGLDPIGRFEMTEFLRTWRNDGKSLIMASHILYEVESVQPSFLLISGGRLLASGSPSEVREILADSPYTLHFRTSDAKKLAQLLIEHCQVDSLRLSSPTELTLSTLAVGEVYVRDRERAGMRNWITGTLSTLRFELNRSFTLQRTSVSLVLALFPPLMVSLIFGGTRLAENVVQNDDVIDGISSIQAHTPFAIIFLVSLVCLLSLLLWATPNVYSELEGKSWGFISSRPGGRMAIFLGKFLSAIMVSFVISMIAMSLSMLVTHRMNLLEDARQLWISLMGIYLLACAAYGAVFSMLGTIFFKRAMVVAAGYLVASEVFLASVPAVIGKFTMRFHLQELGIRWIGFFLPVDNEHEYRMMFGEPLPVWVHLLSLGIGISLCLLIGAIVITNRQYITSEES